jgi:thioredoxin reductase
MTHTWDCIVAGGGAAGLSAGLVLGRARKRTLIVDAGRQSNRSAAAMGGLLGHGGRSPADLYAAGREEIAAHPAVELRTGEVVGARPDEDGFTVELRDGASESARRILLATGMDYRYPKLPGLEERWGRSVFHCPFCHGWEVRDLRLGVLRSVERALLLRGWSEDITLYTDGEALEQGDESRLRDAGIAIETRTVTGVRGPEGELAAVSLDGGEERACSALLVPARMHQRSGLAHELGLALAPPNPQMADAIEVDSRRATSADGVFAAGDATTGMPSVANAIAAGSMAAMSIVHSLL